LLVTLNETGRNGPHQLSDVSTAIEPDHRLGTRERFAPK
jgi:hypothetical protein